MESERESPRPLQADEIKTGIAQIIADAVYDKLGTTCNLFGRAYPKFRGTVKIHLELDDFGMTTEDNHELKVEGGEGDIGTGSVPLDLDIEIPEVPPNQFRMDTDQPIVKTVVEDGKVVEKRVKYQPRKSAAKKAAEKKAAAKKAAKDE